MKLKLTSRDSFYKACLIIACALLLSACEVTFTNPLPLSLYTARDERLLGKWVGRDKGSNAEYVRFTGGPHGEMMVSFERSDPNFAFLVNALKIDGSSYMALTVADGDRRYGYLLAKYTVAGDHMKVWMVDEKKVRQAIREGKLKGVMGTAPYDSSTVTDTSQKILSYIKTPGAFTLLAEFERVADK